MDLSSEDGPYRYNLLVERVLRSTDMIHWLTSTRHLSLRDPDLRADEDGPSPTDPAADPYFKENHEACITCRFVHDFAGRLPNLVSLDLEIFDWAYHSLHPSAYAAFSQFSALRNLKLWGTFPVLSGLRRALSALPALRNLELWNVHFRQAPLPNLPLLAMDRYRGQRPALKSLTFNLNDGDDDPIYVSQWLSHTSTSRSLRELTFHLREFERVDRAFARAFECAETFRQGLQSLNLWVVSCNTVSPGHVVSGLSSCKHLETLVLTFVWPEESRLKTWDSFWTIIAEHVSQLCPAIRTIHLRLRFMASGHISFDGPEHPFTGAIEALEPVFEDEAPVNLQHVVFEFEMTRWSEGDDVPGPPMTLEQVEDAIRTRLTKLHKRGIVQVRHNYKAYREDEPEDQFETEA